MEEFNELKIIGLDENRPPKAEGRGDKSIIHLFLKLSRKASGHWCQDFNRLLEGAIPSVHIQQKLGVSSQESEVKFLLHLGLELKRCTSLTCKLL